VAAGDVEAGQMSPPITNNAESVYPNERDNVHSVLRGRDMVAHYHPRPGPIACGPGLLRAGKAAMTTGRVGVDERLMVTPRNLTWID